MHDTTKSFDVGAARDDSRSLQSLPVHLGSVQRPSSPRSARTLHLADLAATFRRRFPRPDALRSNTTIPRAAATRRPAAHILSNDTVAWTRHMGQTYAPPPPAPVPIMVISPVDPPQVPDSTQKPPPRHLKQHRGRARSPTPSSLDNGDSDSDHECAACTVKYDNQSTACPVCKVLHPDYVECSSCTTHYDKSKAPRATTLTPT
jgi:hypothetical protein